MKVLVEYLPDGLLSVTMDDGTRHIVTECHFRYDGPNPAVDLSIPLGLDGFEVEQKPRTYLDGTPLP